MSPTRDVIARSLLRLLELGAMASSALASEAVCLDASRILAGRDRGDEPDTLRMWRQAITPPKHVKHDDGDNVTISRGTARAYTPAPAGTVSDHQPGGHDDLANAICGVIVQLAKPDAMTIWRRLGRPAGAAA